VREDQAAVLLQSLSPADVREAARACSDFRIDDCALDFLRDMLGLLLEDTHPELAATIRRLPPEQVRALRNDILAVAGGRRR
jgi:hypothetical protein